MAGVEWNDNYKLGIELLDKEHKQLFRVINRLMEHQNDPRNGEWACQEGIKFFESHAVRHFAEEEAYMESIRYKNAERHKKLHDTFRETTLPILRDELERSGYSVEAVNHFVGVAGGWLLSHTLSEDMAIVGGRDDSALEKMVTGDAASIFARVINEFTYDMFNVEARLVTDSYGGERFGDGVYYRLVYAASDGKTLEFILVFEESMLINTVGRILGLETEQLDTRLIHATRYIAKQLIEQVKARFSYMEPYELTEEDLLTYNGMRAVFERNRPNVSLLFDDGTAGTGYFGFCMISPINSEKDIAVGTTIEEENATAEIAQYLEARRNKTRRLKVLIVDDSKTAREIMRELLREDYEVAMAESGVAAIRALTLSKPDIVLLDYEMPVVDGAKTLQMMRLEPDFAKVPVIFLTGKGDQDSVRKLVTLKPQGFLLKTMEPSMLKQKFDALVEQLDAASA